MAVEVESGDQVYRAALNIPSSYSGERIGQSLHFREQAYEAFCIDHIQGNDGTNSVGHPVQTLVLSLTQPSCYRVQNGVPMSQKKGRRITDKGHHHSQHAT